MFLNLLLVCYSFGGQKKIRKVLTGVLARVLALMLVYLYKARNKRKLTLSPTGMADKIPNRSFGITQFDLDDEEENESLSAVDLENVNV